MQRRRTTRTGNPHRGFTLIELLVVISIMAVLAGTVWWVVADSVEDAHASATRSTIRIVDSALQERLEAFDGLNLRSQAQVFELRYNANKAMMTDPDVPQKVAEIMVRKDRYRAAFPQRLEDLWGFDQQAGGGDDAPLWRIWKNTVTQYGVPATDLDPRPAMQHRSDLENSELLFLFLTEGNTFGRAALPLELSARNLRDTPIDRDGDGTPDDIDGDGIPDGNGIPEIYDDWGTPIRFYNWPTRLVRVDGNGMDIEPDVFAATAYVLMPFIPSPPDPTMALPFTQYSHPLNQDPYDTTGAFSAAVISNGFFNSNFDLGLTNQAVAFNETNYHTIDTYYVPLIVSAGSDKRFGLGDPVTGTGPQRLAQPIVQGELYDNLTNRQGSQ